MGSLNCGPTKIIKPFTANVSTVRQNELICNIALPGSKEPVGS